MKKKLISALLAIATAVCCFGFTACNDEEAKPLNFTEKQIELPVGSVYETALVGLEKDETVAYTSNDESVATVDGTGLITGVKIGSAVVKATTNKGKIALMAVTVLDNTMIATPYIKISASSVQMVVEDEFYLSAELLYKGKAVDCELSWKSENSAVATVENGTVKAVGVGEARITVSAEYDGKSVVTVVKVSVSASELFICPDYAGKSVVQGSTIPLSITVIKNGAKITVNEVQYSVSDTKIALIDDGKLFGRSGGDVTVTASFSLEGQDYTCSTPVHVYGEHNVTVYTFEGQDSVLRGLLYGETVTLSLKNALDGREIKCWYVNGEKIVGNTFTMIDGDAVAIAKYVNETEEDFSSRFTRGQLINDSQAKATYKTEAITGKDGSYAEGNGYVLFDAPDWGSLQFNFDENVAVTSTSKVRIRLYCPKETIMLYFGIGENDSVVAGENIASKKEPQHKLGIEIPMDVWTEFEIPLKYFAEIGSVVSGFSISVSNNSYCLLDNVVVLY